MTVDGFADAFTRYVGYRSIRRDERRASCWIERRPDLVDDRGALHAGVLGYLVDSSAGVVCGMAAVPAWIITADLQFHLVAPAKVGPVRADATVAQAGRRQVLGEVIVHDEGDGDRVVAFGTVNHLVIEFADELNVPHDMPIGVEYHSTDGVAVHAPLLEHFGVRKHAPGIVGLPIAGAAVNPLGILHGGLISLLVEQSARSLDGFDNVEIGDIAIRFIRGAKLGHATATANRIVEDAADSAVRVEIVDESGRRLCAGPRRRSYSAR